MGDITKNISRAETACRCNCGQDTIDHQVIEAVQWACDHWARKLGVNRVVCHILSGNRCEFRNSNEGGTDRSQHLFGRAIDFRIDGVKHKSLYESLDKKYNNQYGMGVYSWGVHIDSRSNGPARW